MTATTTTTTTAPTSRTAPPRGNGSARWAGWAGVGFATALIAGFGLVAQVPAYDAPEADWVSWVENDNVTTVIGTMLLTAAGLLLMAFVTTLATLVRGAGIEDDPPITVLRGAGIMAGVTLVIAALVGGAMAAGVTFAPDFAAPGGELIRSLDQLSLGTMLVGTGWSMALAVALASWAARRTGTLPGWLSTGGFVVAALLLLSPMFLPFLLVPLWGLVTGIVVLRAAH
ncbi:MAG TPA: hypothetical protein VLR27_08475 [Acidimicrobiales bacterium]|nr:hypothetical protein [Acidimicrobiales bacterium]